MKSLNSLLRIFQGRQDFALIALLMITVLVMIMPLPTALIDALIVMNFALTILILMVAVYLKKPDDFSTFPAVILIATTFRLAISISTTRMILAQADAGDIIQTFGTFVTAGSVVVGLVVFLIITTVQFVVITKGSERVAEVAARFTLDALPGRQMSIDAELRAGDIDPIEAKQRRSQLEKENQFFGAMDGAMKFVKGDAIAGLIIIAINLIGGMAIGVVGEGLSAGEAGQVYSRLTVGDGLVAQIPALLLAMCAGAVITRVTNGQQLDLGTDIAGQLLGSPKSLIVAGVLMFLVGFIPGFPTLMFTAVAAILIGAGVMLQRSQRAAAVEDGLIIDEQPGAQTLLARIQSKPGDTVLIRVGEEVFDRIEPSDFMAARERAMDRLFADTGIAMPVPGVTLDESLKPDAAEVEVDGVRVLAGTIKDGSLAARLERDAPKLLGIAARPLEQAWPLSPAVWIAEADADAVEDGGFEVVEVADLLVESTAAHLRRYAGNLLSYDVVQGMVKNLQDNHPQLAHQVTQAISPTQLLDAMRRLASDGVPLMPRRVLFEALMEGSQISDKPEIVHEYVRGALRRQICKRYADKNQFVAGYVIEPELESRMRGEGRFDVPPDVADAILSQIDRITKNLPLSVTPPVLLISNELRAPFHHWLKGHNVDLMVMAHKEMAPEFFLHTIGTIGTKPRPAPVVRSSTTGNKRVRVSV